MACKITECKCGCAADAELECSLVTAAAAADGANFSLLISYLLPLSQALIG